MCFVDCGGMAIALISGKKKKKKEGSSNLVWEAWVVANRYIEVEKKTEGKKKEKEKKKSIIWCW